MDVTGTLSRAKFKRGKSRRRHIRSHTFVKIPESTMFHSASVLRLRDTGFLQALRTLPISSVLSVHLLIIVFATISIVLSCCARICRLLHFGAVAQIFGNQSSIPHSGEPEVFIDGPRAFLRARLFSGLSGRDVSRTDHARHRFDPAANNSGPPVPKLMFTFDGLVQHRGNFDATALSTPAIQKIVLKNTGTADLENAVMSFANDPSDSGAFTLVQNPLMDPGVLPRGDTKNLAVAFNPTKEGTFTATLTVKGNNLPRQTFALEGKGTP